MFEKLEKLEEKLNEQISSLQSLMVKIYFFIMPRFALEMIVRLQNFRKAQVIKFKNLLLDCYKRFHQKLISVRAKISALIQGILSYDYKSSLFSFIEKLKTLLLKTPLKSHAGVFSDSLKKRINNIDKAADKVGKGQLAFGFLALTVIGFGFFSVINSTNQILLNEFPERSPASVQEYKHKPEYKSFAKRTVKVLNVKVPVYRDSVKEIRSVTVDFTVRTSTRFAKQYLVHYENQLRDYFFTNVEPVISSFPIEEEGKLVFKEKITDDLNKFLKENHVEGTVEEVGLSFIVAH